ncbi:MAG: adenylate kinase [Nanoarchaeota archaeon]|nr:adenylate kinase [Nanoarchaeota archaeon]
MYIVMFGPPGCGKGTQAEILHVKYNIPAISTGDLFRWHIKNQTELGKAVKCYLDKGELVPDEVTLNIVDERISREDCLENGGLFDGIPRTVYQASRLDELLGKRDLKISSCLNICVPDESIVTRLADRVIGSDGKTYNLVTNPPPGGMSFSRRSDDEPETVRNRLRLYHEMTHPLVEYYARKGIMHTVDGDRPIEIVSVELMGLIDLLAN